ELGLRLLELSLDIRLAVTKRGDLAAELIQAIPVSLDRGRQDALAGLGVLKLGLLVLELRAEVGNRRAARERRGGDEHQDAQREQRPQSACTDSIGVRSTFS